MVNNVDADLKLVRHVWLDSWQKAGHVAPLCNRLTRWGGLGISQAPPQLQPQPWVEQMAVCMLRQSPPHHNTHAQTHMHKHTAYDRGIVVTLCYTQLLSPLFMLHDYVMIWLYILVLTDPRPALRDSQQTLWAGQCHFACGSMPNRFKGVVLLAGDSQSAGWGEGSDSLLWRVCFETSRPWSTKGLFCVNHLCIIHHTTIKWRTFMNVTCLSYWL